MVAPRWVVFVAVVSCSVVVAGLAQARHVKRTAVTGLSADSVEHAEYSRERTSHVSDAVMLRAQILLDRAAISPGQLDAKDGENMRHALAAFQELHGLDPTGKLDRETWQELTRDADEPAMVEYTIKQEDVKGPFTQRIPHGFENMAELSRLAYTSPLDLLAEKFHVAPSVLQRLNPGKHFDAAGDSILVPNVGPRNAEARVAVIEVDKRTKDVRALSANGDLIAFYPASVGSKEKPAPTGRYKVRSIAHDPTYHYDPSFHFKGAPDRKLTIAAGPRNPVGVVWIDLSKPSYGIHGTPDPSRIGKTQSHGCIRLTNWDALDLARRVHKGTPVEFLDGPRPLPKGQGEAQGRE
jgi:lipoprotein-anchoring transpeptidase ErfK/SrfK